MVRTVALGAHGSSAENVFPTTLQSLALLCTDRVDGFPCDIPAPNDGMERTVAHGL